MTTSHTATTPRWPKCNARSCDMHDLVNSHYIWQHLASVHACFRVTICACFLPMSDLLAFCQLPTRNIASTRATKTLALFIRHPPHQPFHEWVPLHATNHGNENSTTPGCTTPQSASHFIFHGLAYSTWSETKHVRPWVIDSWSDAMHGGVSRFTKFPQ